MNSGDTIISVCRAKAIEKFQDELNKLVFMDEFDRITDLDTQDAYKEVLRYQEVCAKEKKDHERRLWSILLKKWQRGE